MVTLLSASFSQDVLIVAMIFFVTSQTIEILNQMTLVPLKHRKALAALKNKFSLLRIYLENDKLSFFGICAVDYILIPLLLVYGLVNVNQSAGLLPVWTVYLGAFMMCFGEAIRLWATYTLGKFFTFAVVVTRDHKLITTGPYKFVRHPAYMGGIIMVFGYGLFDRIWFVPVIALALVCLSYAYRIYVEESALKRRFGRQYVEYAKKLR